MPRIEWIGLVLPSTNPIIAYDKLTGRLTKKQLDAIEKVDRAIIAMVRIDGSTNFELGPKDGLSQHFRWCKENRYVVTMSESDARILSRFGEAFMFRNLDNPREARRTATYPPPHYVTKLVALRHGEVVSPGKLPASVVNRLLRVAKARERMGEEAQIIGRRIGRWGPPPA